ncbi:NADH dehydrogenase [ubiquinone] iron-sulfur protein 6, mitochondrial-like [Clytia hemisphaerica]|uniref:Zinc finger CHCC-type domain-containing protein n=1 Tax=Clytia hemisphaerica TaxID=252671 RepID=A0A7M5WUV9_9CNID
MASSAVLRSLRFQKQLFKLKSVQQIVACGISSSSVICDKITHTGQQFDNEDWKKMRFTAAEKHKLVSENIAFDMVAEEPPTVVNARIVACDGGGGALGHPKVFINLDKPGIHVCGYCGDRYIKAKSDDDH